MAFDQQSGSEAGKKSKRGQGKEIKELREIYSNLLKKNQDKLQNWFDEVGKEDPAKAIDLLIKMSAFVLPKYRQVEFDIVQEKNINVIDLGNGQNPKVQLFDYSSMTTEQLRILKENPQLKENIDETTGT